MPKTRGIKQFHIHQNDPINDFINSPEITPISIAVSGTAMYILYEEVYSQFDKSQ
ncbi:MAG: hypothetical protein ACPKPY_00385 [Nitrososphaeraceae archaeon]